jgi:ppGpp synthetase/RelA/SpoT-type nucleotidyltranferase
MTFTDDELRTKYDADLSRYRRANKRLNELVAELVEDLGEREGVRPGVVVVGEPKTFEKFLKKARKKEAAGEVSTAEDCFVAIGDIARARIVCQTLADCKRLEKLLENHPAFFIDWPRTERYNPSKTGYRATHFRVSVEVVVAGNAEGVDCELQVMTSLQNAWGLFTHEDFYKPEGFQVPPLIGELMQQLSDLLYLADQQADLLIREVDALRAGVAAQPGDGDAPPDGDAPEQ